MKSLLKNSVWFNILLIFATLSLIYFFFFKALGCITHHGEEVVVPKLKGKTIDEAIKAIEALHFQPEVDSIYDPTQKPLVVLKQIPDSGATVKTGRHIILKVNSVVPPLITMPALKGYSLNSAIDNLKAYKLRLGDTSYIPGMEAGLVYAAVYKGDTMQGGEKIYQGSKIDLIIVSGEAKSEINVPNFVGKTYDEILTYITQYNLVPVFYVNPLKGSVITDTSEAKIIYQIPPQYNEKGEPNKLSIGQPISLCLMQNPAPEDYDNAKNIAPPQPPVADTSKKNSRIINDNEDK